MAQKVQFISAVIARPKLLILDEPFSGLDPVNAESLRDAVLELREQGTTIVFSTHDMGVAEKLCDRIFMIFKGNKVLDGSLEEIQQRYGHDTIRVRTSGGAAALVGVPEVESINDHGNYQDVRLKGGSAGLPAAAGAENRRPAVRDHQAVAARHLRAHRETGRGRSASGNGGRPMSRILTIAQSEFLTLVKTKAFIIGIFLMPVLMGLFIFFMSYAERHSDTENRRFAVIDQTGVLYSAVEVAAGASTNSPDPTTRGPVRGSCPTESIRPAVRRTT